MACVVRSKRHGDLRVLARSPAHPLTRLFIIIIIVRIHWFSVFNSFMMVIFLLGLVSMILLRTLRKDYQRYTSDDLESLERDMNEETGWKLVHGDVFRSPMMLELFAAVVGTGVQLATLTLLTITVTIAGELHVRRGTMVTFFVVFYALTSLLGGYVSGSLYAKHDGRSWIQAMLLTANLFPLTVAAIAFTLNTIAIFYNSTMSAPFGTIVVVFVIWVFVSCPLCLLGTVLGRNWAGGSDNPCRVKRIPSPIPSRPWYLSPVPIAAMGGLLPFGSIFIEIYFVFSSFWWVFVEPNPGLLFCSRSLTAAPDHHRSPSSPGITKYTTSTASSCSCS